WPTPRARSDWATGSGSWRSRPTSFPDWWIASAGCARPKRAASRRSRSRSSPASERSSRPPFAISPEEARRSIGSPGDPLEKPLQRRVQDDRLRVDARLVRPIERTGDGHRGEELERGRLEGRSEGERRPDELRLAGHGVTGDGP